MAPLKFSMLSAAILLLGAAGVAHAQPAEVILIRHAEKPADEKSPELSLRGRERAAALVPYFLGESQLLDDGTPVAIFAQSQKKETSSVRALETVQPLADALKIKVDHSHLRDVYQPMVADILHNEKFHGHMVLICWEHKVLVDIAHEFGVENPPKWSGSDYDHTWIIKFKEGEKPALKIVPQKLLYGDADQ